MSLIKTFVDAFKKASARKEPNALEHARSDGHLGPTTGDAAGSFEPLPPPGSGSSGIPSIHGVEPPADSTPIVRPPSEPSPPNEPGEQGPVEGGGGGGTPTPPSAPFNPVEVVFKQAGGGSAPRDLKIEDSPVVEDPDAGGEVADRKADIDSAFVRRLRFSPDTEPSVQSSDPEEGGEVAGGGSGLERGIPEGHVPGELTTVPNASVDLPLADGVEQLVSAESGSEQRRGNLLTQVEQEGGTPPADREAPADEDSEGEGELVSLGDGRGSQLSDERGAGLLGGLKLEGDYKVAGAGPSIASSDPEEGGEVFSRLGPRPPVGAEIPAGSILEDPDAGGEVFSKVEFKIESADLKFGEYKVEPDYKPEGDWKVEDGIKFEGLGSPASPPGSPIPYPNVEGDGDALAESLARKAGGAQQEFFKVKMEEVMVTSARTGSEPLDEQAGEAPVTREAFDGIKGESQDKDHTGEMAFARRTEVKDAHDRFSDTKPDTPPKPPAQLIDDDDDFESSSLLDLKPEPDVKEMLPGLAGELPDDAELDFDLDDDLDDTDESEL